MRKVADTILVSRTAHQFAIFSHQEIKSNTIQRKTSIFLHLTFVVTSRGACKTTCVNGRDGSNKRIVLYFPLSPKGISMPNFGVKLNDMSLEINDFLFESRDSLFLLRIFDFQLRIFNKQKYYETTSL